MFIAVLCFSLLILIMLTLIYYFWYMSDDDTNTKELQWDLLMDEDDTMIDIFDKITENYGHLSALKFKNEHNKWETVTYRDYYNQSFDMATRLLYFVGPVPRVGILSYNNPEWFYIHMGTLMAGGVSIGMYTTSSMDNCEYVVNHACIDLLVVEDYKQLTKFNTVMTTVKTILILTNRDFENGVDDETYDKLLDDIKEKNPHLKIFTYGEFIEKRVGGSRMNATIELGDIKLTDPASIIYTSGTTGRPKGCVLTHCNLVSSLRAGLNSVKSGSKISMNMRERFVSYLPLNHIAAQMMDIYLPLATVGTVHFADKDAMKGSLVHTMKYAKPTVFVGVPRVYEKMMEKIREKKRDSTAMPNMVDKMFVNKIVMKELGLHKCKFAVAAAAPLMKETRDFFGSLGLELCDVYGLTETCGSVAMGLPGKSNGVGNPIVRIKIDKDTDEILVKSKTVFKEYYKDPEATKQAFAKRGWFKTGDTGYLERDGSLYITGRIKDIIIGAGGENIAPVPIEEILKAELNKNKTVVEYVVLTGNNRKFLAVLLFPIERKKLREAQIEKAIGVVNKCAPNNTSTIKKYLVMDNEVLTVNDCLTPTFKIKRNVIDDKYKDQIDNLYRDLGD